MLGSPIQRPDLIVHSSEPFNAEPPLDRLRAAFVTPVADCYIRTHGPIPIIDPRLHSVRFGSNISEDVCFTVADLMARLAPRTVRAVMQCAGNRRADLQQVEATSGDPWASGAIANVDWTGVSLADVLRAIGTEMSADLHVAFEGLDAVENKGAPDAPYGASIPLGKAACPDVLLAWSMNGEPLLPEHGAPLRVVVPGYAGVRSVKWLTSVTVRDTPSEAYQQRHDYLMFPPDMREATLDLARGTPINEMPLNAAICDPQPGANLPAGLALVRGYAVATDRPVVRVDVSSNGGRTWQQATLETEGRSRWSWTFWHASLDLAPGEHELAVRAWDAAGQTQPALPDDTWNFKGYLSASWHRVRVTVR